MSPPELLAGLRERGVRVALEDGELKLRGPASALTPQVLAEAKSHKPALRELLLLEALAAPVAPVEVERQVLELSPLAAEPTLTSTCSWREVLRPDLRKPLGLEALDLDPPEPCPHPAFVWVRDLGCWQHGEVIVSTVATGAQRARYYAARKQVQVLEAGAEDIFHEINPPTPPTTTPPTPFPSSTPPTT